MLFKTQLKSTREQKTKRNQREKNVLFKKPKTTETETDLKIQRAKNIHYFLSIHSQQLFIYSFIFRAKFHWKISLKFH